MYGSKFGVKSTQNLLFSFGRSCSLFLLFPSTLLVVANLSLLPLNFHLGKKVLLPTRKIPKYRSAKLTKQDSPAQTVWNKHDKKIYFFHSAKSSEISAVPRQLSESCFVSPPAGTCMTKLQTAIRSQILERPYLYNLPTIKNTLKEQCNVTFETFSSIKSDYDKESAMGSN